MIYQVWLPPNASSSNARDEGEILQRCEFASIHRDGLAPMALVFPGLWLLFNRLWYEFSVYFLISIAILLFAVNGNYIAYWLAGIFPGLYLFLEGRNLIADKMQRKGYELDRTIPAHSWREAEIIYFHKLNERHEEDLDPKQDNLSASASNDAVS